MTGKRTILGEAACAAPCGVLRLKPLDSLPRNGNRQEDKITSEQGRAGRIVKKGRLAKMLIISIALLGAGFPIAGYVNN